MSEKPAARPKNRPPRLSVLDTMAALSRPAGIQEAERAWAGGISDTGDSEAALMVQGMPGYFDYRSGIEDALRASLGDEFVVYRCMPQAQLDEWFAGRQVGPLAATLDLEVAAAWHRFAGHEAEEMLVVQITIGPWDVLMLGKHAEAEVVIDGDAVDPQAIEVIERQLTPPKPR